MSPGPSGCTAACWSPKTWTSTSGRPPMAAPSSASTRTTSPPVAWPTAIPPPPPAPARPSTSWSASPAPASPRSRADLLQGERQATGGAAEGGEGEQAGQQIQGRLAVEDRQQADPVAEQAGHQHAERLEAIGDGEVGAE